MNPTLSIKNLREEYTRPLYQKFPIQYFTLLKGCDTYPLYPYNIKRFSRDDLFQFESLNSESFNIVKDMVDKGVEFFVTGMNEFENRTSLRLFCDGSISHPKFGKEYRKIQGIKDLPEGKVHYYCYDFSTDKKYGDYIYLNLGTNYFLVWFYEDPSESENDPPLPFGTYKYPYYKVYWNKDNLEETIEEVVSIFKTKLDCFCFYDEYNKALIVGKNYGIPDADNSTIPRIDLPYVQYDLECGFEYGNESLDIYSKLNTKLENIFIEITKVKDGYYNLVVRCYDTYDEDTNKWSGNIYYSEAYLNKTLEELIYNININSRIIEIKSYGKSCDIIGEYQLKRVSDITPLEITAKQRIQELEISDYSMIPDVVLDTVNPESHEDLVNIFKDYSVFLLQDTTCEGDQIYNFVNKIKNTIKNEELPSARKCVHFLQNNLFEGQLAYYERPIETSEYTLHSNELVHNLLGDYFNRFESTTYKALYRELTVRRIQNILYRNLEGRSSVEEIKDFIKNNASEFNNIGLKECNITFPKIEELTRQRKVKITVKFEFTDKRIDDYSISVVLNII